uniref:Putative secreted protein n=1 Tax=Anopheles marajoara TaxID=58244 RepID=A0A2M4C909_9DIPT
MKPAPSYSHTHTRTPGRPVYLVLVLLLIPGGSLKNVAVPPSATSRSALFGYRLSGSIGCSYEFRSRSSVTAGPVPSVGIDRSAPFAWFGPSCASSRS